LPVPTVEELFALASRHIAAGQLAQAERLLHQVLALQPRHAEALHQLGVLSFQSGRAREAVGWFGRAVQARPGDPCLLSCLGAAHQSLGQLEEAVRWHREALRHNPAEPLALNNLGIALASLGRAAEAVTSFREALRIQPGDAGAWCNLGAVLRALGKLDEAANCYRRALTLKPDLAQAHFNLGNALRDMNRFPEAEACYRRAAELTPGFVAAYRNWGELEQGRGRPAEAAGLFRQGLQHQPADPETLVPLARSLLALNRPGEAVESCRRALQARPGWPAALAVLGAAWSALGELDAAADCHREALRAQPGLASAHYNLGLVLQAQGQIEESCSCFREALARDPNNHATHSTYLCALLYDPAADPATLHAEHCRWANLHAPGPSAPVIPRALADRRLRVGYVSPDFRNHAVARFLEPVLAHHDRARVEVFCYADVAAPDETTARLRGQAEHWSDTLGLSDAELADLVRRDGVDVLVDLAGHTAGNRLRAFARRPAPVQVSYLGYAFATGLPALALRLGDAVTDPEGEPALAGDEVARLPGCFCCYAPPREVELVQELPSEREGVVTFGSLHKLEKLNDAVLDVWCRLLREAPNTRLLLGRNTLHGQTAEGLRRRFMERGVAAERLLLERVTASGLKHLGVYDRVDVALDVWPWCGHTTACEALWMGVPVVSLRGRHHAGRMTASVLTALGLEELIAATPEEYCRLARELAATPDRRAALRRTLRSRMLASSLCDAAAFTRGLEETYRWLVSRGSGAGS
jgi:predicted O-linked N-acetylglucosamine transferase (SPINDLY family)